MLDTSIIQQLRELCGDDIVFKKELISAFEQQFTDELPLMKRMQKQGDIQQVSAIAHKLKGSALNLGAVQLAALLEVFESLVNNPQPQSDYSHTVAELEQIYQQSLAALHNQL